MCQTQEPDLSLTSFPAVPTVLSAASRLTLTMADAKWFPTRTALLLRPGKTRCCGISSLASSDPALQPSTQLPAACSRSLCTLSLRTALRPSHTPQLSPHSSSTRGGEPQAKMTLGTQGMPGCEGHPRTHPCQGTGYLFGDAPSPGSKAKSFHKDLPAAGNDWGGMGQQHPTDRGPRSPSQGQKS